MKMCSCLPMAHCRGGPGFWWLTVIVTVAAAIAIAVALAVTVAESVTVANPWPCP